MTELSSNVLSVEQLKKLKSDIGSFVSKRAASKTRVTKLSSKLLALVDLGNVDPKIFAVHKSCIEKSLDDVQEWDAKIISFLSDNDNAKIDPNILDREIDKQSEYFLDIQSFIVSHEPPNPTTSTRLDAEDVQALAQCLPKSDARLPPMQCGNFSGNDDKLDFRSFFVQFKNLIDAKRDLTPAAKLSYLRGYLRGYALKVISYLDINDANYDIAIKLLKDEFLDVPHIKEQMFKKLIELSPKFDSTYQQTRIYINEIRSLVHEFSNYNIDFLIPDSAGFALLSYIVFTKLPKPFQRDLVRKIDNNYPCINDVFDHYNEIIRGLVRSNSNKFDSTSKHKTDVGNKSKDNGEKPSTLYNFKTTTENDRSEKPCKFCNVLGHAICGVVQNFLL